MNDWLILLVLLDTVLLGLLLILAILDRGTKIVPIPEGDYAKLVAELTGKGGNDGPVCEPDGARSRAPDR